MLTDRLHCCKQMNDSSRSLPKNLHPPRLDIVDTLFSLPAHCWFVPNAPTPLRRIGTFWGIRHSVTFIKHQTPGFNIPKTQKTQFAPSLQPT